MSAERRVRDLLQRYVEHHVVHGERLALEQLCTECPSLLNALKRAVARYEKLHLTLTGPNEEDVSGAQPPGAPLPSFEGFRTVERLGGGGAGEVYKLEDRQLGRIVAAKVIRDDNPLRNTVADFLREARSLALFEDERIVRIFEFRKQADPPVLLMEYVDGFELTRIAGSLEFGQRARLMAEICDAVHHAHSVGIQHRDLKPANILIDAKLAPKILDFGLSRSEPGRGHGVGTPAYMAPEQFEPEQRIDAAADIHALGVILYEVLCGALPYRAATQDALIAEIKAGQPRLPAEIEPEVPEPLQAIALKAMERNPAERYGSALEMAQDLLRFVGGKPVLARPTLYQTALGRRIQPHLEQIREWFRLKLIYGHEADRLNAAYRSLQARDEDWIIQSRRLSLSQISLYLGAFFLLCGAILYFTAYVFESIDGVAGPTLMLVLPFAGLNVAAMALYHRHRQAVAVAFCLAAVVLLPLFLLIVLQESGTWTIDPERDLEFLGWLSGRAPSNRQLQVASLTAAAWSCFLAFATRTVTLSACFSGFAVVFNLSVLADFGLRRWLEEGQFDALAVHLVPFLVLCIAMGIVIERHEKPWFARPLYAIGSVLYVVVLELVALDGKAFAHLGISTAPLAGNGDPVLLDSLAAMTLNGILIYAGGRLIDKRGTELMKMPAWLLYTISPFAILEPIAYLNGVGEFSSRYTWFYLALSLLIALLSRVRQRKSFYYAGLANTGGALWYITDLHEWWDETSWAVAVIGIGLAVLGIGLGLHLWERSRSSAP